MGLNGAQARAPDGRPDGLQQGHAATLPQAPQTLQAHVSRLDRQLCAHAVTNKPPVSVYLDMGPHLYQKGQLPGGHQSGAADLAHMPRARGVPHDNQSRLGGGGDRQNRGSSERGKAARGAHKGIWLPNGGARVGCLCSVP